MGLFNSISNKIASSIAKKKSVKLTSYGQQKVKEAAKSRIESAEKNAGIKNYTKPSSEPKKTNSTISKSMPYVSFPKSSGSKSTTSSNDKKSSSSSNKQSNKTYTLSNPFVTKAYASTDSSVGTGGTLANSQTPNSMFTYNSPGWQGATKFLNFLGVEAVPGQKSFLGVNLPDVMATERGYLGGGSLTEAQLPYSNYGTKADLTYDPNVGLMSGDKLAITPEFEQQDAAIRKYLADNPTISTGNPTNDYLLAAQVLYGNAPDADTGTGTGEEIPLGSNWNPSNMPSGEELFGALREGMEGEERAAMDAAIAEYERQRTLLQNQLTYAEQQRQNALGTYSNQYNDVLSQLANAKTNAERDTAVGRQNVFDTARQTQRSNRNVLRSLGILSSSAAGEMLNKPYTEASKQAANMENLLLQKKQELDTLKVQKDSEYANSIRDLETNYAKMISDIQADIRYTEAEKIAAVRELTAAAQTRYAELQQAQLNWENQLRAQQQQFALDMARMQAYSGIKPDMSGILQNSLVDMV